MTDQQYTRSALYSYSIHFRAQDKKDPIYYFQVGYGNTQYLEKNRFLFELSMPFSAANLTAETNFYDPNTTQYYFFANTSIHVGSGVKDDILSFGFKGLLSVGKIATLLSGSASSSAK